MSTRRECGKPGHPVFHVRGTSADRECLDGSRGAAEARASGVSATPPAPASTPVARCLRCEAGSCIYHTPPAPRPGGARRSPEASAEVMRQGELIEEIVESRRLTEAERSELARGFLSTPAGVRAAGNLVWAADELAHSEAARSGATFPRMYDEAASYLTENLVRPSDVLERSLAIRR